MNSVTVTTIVDTLQILINKCMDDPKIPIKDRVKAIVALTGRQLQAGALNLGYQKLAVRSPEDSPPVVARLNPPEVAPEATTQ